jgi:hypothetical protein
MRQLPLQYSICGGPILSADDLHAHDLLGRGLLDDPLSAVRARERPAEPLKPSQDASLQPDRDARQEELGVVRSRRRHPQRVAPPLGIEVAGTIQSERALDEAREPQRWAELHDHFDCVFASGSDGMRLTRRRGDGLAGAKDTLDSAADREHRAADDLDALLLSGMDVKGRRRCIASHPEVEAQ